MPGIPLLAPAFLHTAAICCLTLFMLPRISAGADTVRIASQSADVFATPLNGAIPIGSVHGSTLFPLLSEVPGWYEIPFGNAGGWIKDRDAGKMSGPVAHAASAVRITDSVRITGSAADIHESASGKSAVIGHALQGEIFGVFSAQEGWFGISFNDRMGWVYQGEAQRLSLDRLRRTGPQATAVITAAGTDRVRIVRPSASIYGSPDGDAAFLSTARLDAVYAVVARTSGWIAVPYYDGRGWIREQDCAPVGAAKQPTPVEMTRVRPTPRPAPGASARGASPHMAGPTGRAVSASERHDTLRVATAPKAPDSRPFQPAISPWAPLFVSTLIAFPLLLIALLLVGRTRKNRSGHFRGQPRRRCLVVAKRTKRVQSLMLDRPVTLQECFRDIGFAVFTAKDIAGARRAVSRFRFDVVLVDWRLEKSVPGSAQWLTPFRAPGSNIGLIVYNVPNLDKVRSSPGLRVNLLGTSFSDRDVFATVKPAVVAEGRMDGQSHALDGTIQPFTLTETFQFIAAARKTGCLLVERSGPYAIVYFDRGRIVHASTPDATGREAALAVLDLTDGKFHFIGDRMPAERNCDCPALAVIMEWAYRSDEAVRAGN